MESIKVKSITREMLVRYQLILKEDETNKIPNFESFECCKEIGICKILFESGKYYSGTDIEKMSVKFGYSVWDRIGNTELNCKCKWKDFVVTPKNESQNIEEISIKDQVEINKISNEVNMEQIKKGGKTLKVILSIIAIIALILFLIR